MDRESFAERVGEFVLHRTPVANSEGISTHGLLRPVEIARRAGLDPSGLILRRDRTSLIIGNHTASLNHQQPLRAGANQADRFLDGHTLASWSAQLDNRIFFWPERAGKKFGESLDASGPAETLRLDARRFFDFFAPHMFLSPINSGCATRRAAMRGDWLYVSVLEPWDQFADNRRTRKLVKTRDRIEEISITTDIDSAVLERLQK